MIDEPLRKMSRRFNRLYSITGRASIAREKFLRALLLQTLYSIRSERMLMEQMEDNLLFRWFVGLNLDVEVWDPTTFSKNRGRLIKEEIAQAFVDQVLKQVGEHGSLCEAD